MPHLPYEPVAEEEWAQHRWGRQFREAAETSTSKTASEYAPGRGFPGGATPPPPRTRWSIDEADLSTAIAVMKGRGTLGIKPCGCGLDTPPHSH